MRRLFSFILSCFFITKIFAAEVPIFDFPLENYNQAVDSHFHPQDSDYETPFLSRKYQLEQIKIFFLHNFDSSSTGLSPWSANYINGVMPFLKSTELEILNNFDNSDKPSTMIHYKSNFKRQDSDWIPLLANKMRLPALEHLQYNPDHRAIIVANTAGRALPEASPDFFHFTLPGQGFPFDNLQESALWVGTPVYVFTLSADKAWALVLTPDAYFTWIKSSDLAYASENFIKNWQEAADKGLMAITKTETPVLDEDQQFQFQAYIGSIFPRSGDGLLIPRKNLKNQAIIARGVTRTNTAQPMPFEANKKNLALLLKQLQGRPYGWGGIFFDNDCSQEMKSLFTPFGIWLPRNTAQQAKLNNTIDLSDKSVNQRLAYLIEKGKPLLTLIYIGGHVMLYLGKEEGQIMTYQNLWGLSPENRDKRYLIGQSVFLPLLKHFPENPELASQAGKALFKLIYLEKLTDNLSPAGFVQTFFGKPKAG